MKPAHRNHLVHLMEEFLEYCDLDGGNPELCYDSLAQDMASAAGLVYDACMRGQNFSNALKPID